VPPDLVRESLPGEAGCRVLSAGGAQPQELPAGTVGDVLDSLVGTDDPVVLDLPAASALLPSVLRHAPFVVVLSGLRTRALADADALVDRVAALAEGGSAPPDLRLVTRGPRPGAAVLDDVVAHLGVAHLHHLPDDPRVGRDAERGSWPGTSGDAVHECAERVVEAAGWGSGAMGRAS
jgi:hypothetical protein